MPSRIFNINKKNTKNKNTIIRENEGRRNGTVLKDGADMNDEELGYGDVRNVG